jgi:hypothetical protein
MLTHIFTESVTRREQAHKNAQNLRECIREDREAFHQQTSHEWYSRRAQFRTFLLALGVTTAGAVVYICVHLLH